MRKSNEFTAMFDRLLFGFIVKLAMPILCFLAAWWTTLIFTDNSTTIVAAALSGFAVGLLIDVLIKQIRKADIYRLSMPTLMLIYLFYTCCMFGFFMGVPIFHPALGVIAGYYWIQRLLDAGETGSYRAEIKKVSTFTSVVIAAVGLSSAIFALMSKSTPTDLKYMFHLPFDITPVMLYAIIVVGGIMLVLTQYWLTKATMIWTLKRNGISKLS
jgi:hypothetical protein